MRFESITAHSFGPLVSATLEPSEGLTVVAGPNESGKSSWHAATYAALCGRRRGRGAPVEDRQFAEQRKPWDGRGWKVAAVAVLANGRRIELTHDLAGGVDSSAVELDLGRRDVSSEIISDGAPDGSRWLGLDRRSFAATALVNQADVLEVLHHAQGLQELLQRAAATAGTDETAAAALVRLRDFYSEHVGLERVNSRKPLRAAQVAGADARSRLDEAQRVHAEYLGLVEQQQTLERGAQQCRSDLLTGRARLDQLIAFESVCRALDAAAQEAARAGVDEGRARAEAAEAADQAGKAHEAWVACGGVRPLETTAAQQEVEQLQACLTRWCSLPDPETVVGESSDRLRERMAELPDAPDGDTAEHVDVVRGATERDTALRAQEEHERAKPQSEPPLGDQEGEDPALAAAATAGASYCRELASQLAAYDGDRTLDEKLADAGTKLSAAEAERRSLEQQLAEAQSDVTGRTDGARPSHGGARLATSGGTSAGGAVVALGIGSGALLTGGVALLAIGQVVLGAIVIALAGIVGLTALVMRRRTPVTAAGSEASSGPVDDRVRQLTEALRTAERREEGVRGEWTGLDASRKLSASTRDAVVAEAESRGLPSDPAELRRLATQVELRRKAHETWEDWARTARSRQAAVETATEDLRRALNARGMTLSGSDDVMAALQSYRSDCESNAVLRKGADEKARLEAQLTSRVLDEQRVQRATTTRQAARSEVIAGATAAGLHVEPNLDDQALASAVEEWLEKLHEDQREAQRTRDAWTQLETLLSGRTLEQMDELAEKSKAEVEAAAAVRMAAEESQEKAECERRRHVAAFAELGRDLGGVARVVDAHRLVTEEQAVVNGLQHASDESRASAAQLAGQVAERALTLVSVPECEEALAAAERELARVEELGRILRTTVDFLEGAQDRVHRDIAPVLSATMSDWLPQLTEGRYTLATVDPSSLHVEVQTDSGVWRDADKLSVGTREQVYLLLRVALAQHLPTPAEPCPLILDDVTVQADEARTRAMLEWLLVRSAERQIILFAQEPLVAEWARGKVGVDGFSLVELEQLPTSSGTPA